MVNGQGAVTPPRTRSNLLREDWLQRVLRLSPQRDFGHAGRAVGVSLEGRTNPIPVRCMRGSAWIGQSPYRTTSASFPGASMERGGYYGTHSSVTEMCAAEMSVRRRSWRARWRLKLVLT
jgi:hypothetical protein